MYEKVYKLIRIRDKKTKALIGYISDMSDCYAGNIKIKKNKTSALKFSMNDSMVEALTALRSVNFDNDYIFDEAYIIVDVE